MMTYGDNFVFDLRGTGCDKFEALGRGAFWYRRYDVAFEAIENEERPNFVTISFETELFPTFERDLKFVDAPSPPTICPVGGY